MSIVRFGDDRILTLQRKKERLIDPPHSGKIAEQILNNSIGERLFLRGKELSARFRAM